jgi:hypothetical protein
MVLQRLHDRSRGFHRARVAVPSPGCVYRFGGTDGKGARPGWEGVLCTPTPARVCVDFVAFKVYDGWQRQAQLADGSWDRRKRQRQAPKTTLAAATLFLTFTGVAQRTLRTGGRGARVETPRAMQRVGERPGVPNAKLGSQTGGIAFGGRFCVGGHLPIGTRKAIEAPPERGELATGAPELVYVFFSISFLRTPAVFMGRAEKNRRECRPTQPAQC